MRRKWMVVTLLFFSQYLPVYAPSEEEKENPALFASNVRKLMAKYVCSGVFGRCCLWTPLNVLSSDSSLPTERWRCPSQTWVSKTVKSSCQRVCCTYLTSAACWSSTTWFAAWGELRGDWVNRLESNRLTLPLSSQSNGLRLGRRRQPCRWCLEAGATLTPFVSRKYYTRAQATSCQSQIQLHCITRMTYFLIFPLFIIRLRAETSEKQLEELARRARKLQGERLAPKDFAQFLNLPVTDTLTHTHRLFGQVNTHAGRG